MALEFKNITDIVIPQGSLIKIHETVSGRILWQKKTSPAGDYPKTFVYLNMNCCQGYIFPFYKDKTFGTVMDWVPSGMSKQAVAYYVRQPENIGQAVSNLVRVGDKFTAYYVDNANDESNLPSTAKEVPNCSWEMSTNIGPLEGQKISMDAKPFITFSGLNSATLTVASIKNDLSEYLADYEAYSSSSFYRSKSEQPYLMGFCQTNCKSPFPDYPDDRLGGATFMFVIKR